MDRSNQLEDLKKTWPEKFASEDEIFSHIHPGDKIFIGTGCGEPQYLVQALVNFVGRNPKAFFGIELIHVWTLGAAPYIDEQFRDNFRIDSFFISEGTRNAINRGAADYTPVSLSAIPGLIRREIIPIDVALIQTSPPDKHGYMSLGISVDIVKAATQKASLIVAQINSHMPRTQGDGFININDVDFIISHDEPLLEYTLEDPGDIIKSIGKYVARIVEDESTLQVGYGIIPNAVVSYLGEKKHLGVHTELLSDGIIDLMQKGVVDNTKKSIDTGKTVASYCMGKKETYDLLDENPTIEFKTIDYVNNPLIIAQNRLMTAINSAMEIDLTGQATAESLSGTFYFGIGGQADFMRGAALAPGGKSILALPSTALDDTISRIVPSLQEGTGVTLTRSDVHYVVTEYGIAYLHGKNIRERAMDLIAIAHPKFRPWLIKEAKKRLLIYKDQAFIPGMNGVYPAALETFRTTKTGLNILLRPVKIGDEPLMKDFFYALSNDSMYRRFMSVRMDMPHERLQEFGIVNYANRMMILAIVEGDSRETIAAIGQYEINEKMHTAEVALVVKDKYQNMGVGHDLLSYLTSLARRGGLLGFTAEVLVENKPMLNLFKKMGFDTEKRSEEGVYEMRMMFRDLEV
ncbi:MAG: GNAT family N-acetyltransferase [Methanothrix sp.]|jgi:acyl-CoA hydrolase/L-amino acid N-acyltransferase YncA|uniref:Acetyl-CoA hydrolase/N-acetyltransferase GNAT family fusion protein n=1 Tax=Methanothrix harundinacea TaxID=301375 RepID=A0A101FUS4_9EURY|nr:MAG: Acetyl-CoA hydrolase/N-acetyltransferase GNAT family fusion protein [Methanothrix harundinacea]MDD3709713.1 GNAT family N-acetyltransferase [Methanothrix sp.]MDI9399505.1 GNAT family N-acetyltransferase [Euryarchaeota archaeon]KUK96397.1 MAG: Acetyl-CoA hydrolase/N-acetyltransferase GNAT family fusion protein [Methanothrix harundinacea]MCP1391760.1 GNAT family N-acetyltransferase [Methanothrix harundinacea]